jgi:hypothetical protein
MLSDLKLSQRLQSVKFPRVRGFAKIDWRPKHTRLSVALMSGTGGMIETAVCFIIRSTSVKELLYATILKIPTGVYYI